MDMKPLNDAKTPWLLPFLIWLVVSILGKTWRFRVVSPPSVDIFDVGAAPKVYCFWHANLLVVSYLFRNTGKAAIVSKSRDGLIAAGVAARLGHAVVFGSSGRGGVGALREGARALREGRSLGITPDGPKGPREVAKPGAAQVAILGRASAVTIKVDTKSAWRLKSWDRFMIPYPFAIINVVLSEPIEPIEGEAGSMDTANNAGGISSVSGGGRHTAMTKSIQDSLT
ncbi:MAG: lysophospholipid acyltransferase family protein [Chitinispirillales bacterium]|nr:lysophospholipid acyltransferase family protein [Chitinispirillales bacterium]